MKVFFGVSLRADKNLILNNHKIYELIEKFGGENLNGLPVLKEPTSYYQLSTEELRKSYIDLTAKIKKADIVIVETTIHSLTMGYFVKAALDLDKPTIILHSPGCQPYYFSGIQNDRLQILEYTLETLPEVLKAALKYAKENIDVRFNLFISPEVNNYLKWAAQKYSTQKATFVRSLILNHKEEHLAEYQADFKK